MGGGWGQARANPRPGASEGAAAYALVAGGDPAPGPGFPGTNDQPFYFSARTTLTRRTAECTEELAIPSAIIFLSVTQHGIL